MRVRVRMRVSVRVCVSVPAQGLCLRQMALELVVDSVCLLLVVVVCVGDQSVRPSQSDYCDCVSYIVCCGCV